MAASSDAVSRDDMISNFRPGKFVPQLRHVLQVYPNETADYTQPHIRTSLSSSYPFFISIFIIVIIISVVVNIFMLRKIHSIVCELTERKTNFTEYLFLGNISLLNLVLAMLVLPVSLAPLLVQNWVFGKFICYVTPIMQVSIMFI